MGISIITSAGGGGAGYSLSDFRTDHRVAYYNCADDGTSGLQDSEGTNHLTENGSSSATFGNTGVNGNCIGLTGNNDRFYLQSSNICPSASQDLVISMWIKPNASTRLNMFIFNPNNTSIISTNIFFQTIAADRVRFGWNSATVSTEHAGSGIDVADGDFHHVLFIMEKTENNHGVAKMYLDGQGPVTSLVVTNTLDLSAGYFILGRIGGDNVAAGLYDEIELFIGMGIARKVSDTIITEWVTEYD